MSNPLLAGDELPAFGDIRSEHVAPALDLLLAQAEAALAHAVGPQVPPVATVRSAFIGKWLVLPRPHPRPLPS